MNIRNTLRLLLSVVLALKCISVYADSLIPGKSISATNLLQAQVSGAYIGQDVNISESAAGNHIATNAEVIMEVNPLNPKHLVAMARSHLFEYFLYYSLDGGKNWQHVNTTDLPITVDFGLTDPSLTFDDEGNLYAIAGDPGQHKAVLCQFMNGAFTSNPVIPNHCTVLVVDDKWHLGAGPARGNPMHQNLYFVDRELVVRYSTNGGITFTNSTQRLGSGSFPRPIVAGNGDLYVAWYNTADRLIRIRRSGDNGQHFDATQIVAQTRTSFSDFYNSCQPTGAIRVPAQPCRGIFAGPVIDVDRSGGPFDGRLYVAYVDEGTHGAASPFYDYDIFVMRSDDGGVTWLPARPIKLPVGVNKPTASINDDAGAATQFLPWLDVDQKTGTVSVVWYDTRADSVNVKVRTYLATSVDGGRTFGPNIPIADAESDESDHGNYMTARQDYLEYIGVAVDNCVAHVVWSDNDMTHATAEGYFRNNPTSGSTLTLNGATWTFVSGAAVGNQTQIGANKSETLLRLINDLSASSDPLIQQAHYANEDDVLIIQATARGAAGGDFTIEAAMPDPLNPAGPPVACQANNQCFVNFVDSNYHRLFIATNLKTDQVPVPCTPGERMLVTSGLTSPPASDRILRYEGNTGTYMDVFIPNCVDVNPLGNCAMVPGAAEHPVDMVIGPDRKLYVADRSIGGTLTIPSGIAVKRYNGATGIFEDIDDPYAAFIHYGDGGLVDIGGLAFGPDSNLYVSDYSAGKILRFHGQTGQFMDDYVVDASLNSPGKLLFGPDGNLYVLEFSSNRVMRYAGPFTANPGTSLGEYVTSGSGGLAGPSAATFASDNTLYVASYTSDSVLRYQGPFAATPGAYVDTFVPANKGGLSRPTGMAFGPKSGRLYVSSHSNDRILGFDPQTTAFTGMLAYVGQPGALLFSSVPEKLASLGDFTGDGCVSTADLLNIISAVRLNTTDLKYDLNGDGIVNIADARKLVLLFTNPGGSACP